MRVLRPVIEALVRAMLDRRHDLALGCRIGADFVGDHAPRRKAPLFEKAPQQAPRCLGVTSRLNDLIEDIAVLIDYAPKPALLAADGDADHLVERLVHVSHHGWKHSRRPDLSDEGLLADFERHGMAGAN